MPGRTNSLGDITHDPLADCYRVFRRVDLAARYGVTPTSILRWVEAGHLPPENVIAADGTPIGWSQVLIYSLEQVPFGSTMLRERRQLALADHDRTTARTEARD